MNKSRDKPAKHAPGPWTALPDEVVRCPAFADLSHRARSLLLCVIGEFNRFNNGDIAITLSNMRTYGWNSDDQMRKAIKELEEHGFLRRTQQGGRNRPNLFALTFFNVQPCYKEKMKHAATVTAPRCYLDWTPENTSRTDTKTTPVRTITTEEIPGWADNPKRSKGRA